MKTGWDYQGGNGHRKEQIESQDHSNMMRSRRKRWISKVYYQSETRGKVEEEGALEASKLRWGMSSHLECDWWVHWLMDVRTWAINDLDKSSSGE